MSTLPSKILSLYLCESVPEKDLKLWPTLQPCENACQAPYSFISDCRSLKQLALLQRHTNNAPLRPRTKGLALPK